MSFLWLKIDQSILTYMSINWFKSVETGFLICKFWLIWLEPNCGSCRVTLLVAFGFLPQNFKMGRDLWMVLCHSMNAGWVVGILRGRGDTQILPAVINFIWNVCTQRQWECWHFALMPTFAPHTRAIFETFTTFNFTIVMSIEINKLWLG